VPENQYDDVKNHSSNKTEHATHDIQLDGNDINGAHSSSISHHRKQKSSDDSSNAVSRSAELSPVYSTTEFGKAVVHNIVQPSGRRRSKVKMAKNTKVAAEDGSDAEKNTGKSNAKRAAKHSYKAKVLQRLLKKHADAANEADSSKKTKSKRRVRASKSVANNQKHLAQATALRNLMISLLLKKEGVSRKKANQESDSAECSDAENEQTEVGAVEDEPAKKKRKTDSSTQGINVVQSNTTGNVATRKVISGFDALRLKKATATAKNHKKDSEQTHDGQSQSKQLLFGDLTVGIESTTTNEGQKGQQKQDGRKVLRIARISFERRMLSGVNSSAETGIQIRSEVGAADNTSTNARRRAAIMSRYLLRKGSKAAPKGLKKITSTTLKSVRSMAEIGGKATASGFDAVADKNSKAAVAPIKSTAAMGAALMRPRSLHKKTYATVKTNIKSAIEANKGVAGEHVSDDDSTVIKPKKVVLKTAKTTKNTLKTTRRAFKGTLIVVKGAIKIAKLIKAIKVALLVVKFVKLIVKVVFKVVMVVVKLVAKAITVISTMVTAKVIILVSTIAVAAVAIVAILALIFSTTPLIDVEAIIAKFWTIISMDNAVNQQIADATQYADDVVFVPPENTIVNTNVVKFLVIYTYWQNNDWDYWPYWFSILHSAFFTLEIVEEIFYEWVDDVLVQRLRVYVHLEFRTIEEIALALGLDEDSVEWLEEMIGNRFLLDFFPELGALIEGESSASPDEPG